MLCCDSAKSCDPSTRLPLCGRFSECSKPYGECTGLELCRFYHDDQNIEAMDCIVCGLKVSEHRIDLEPQDYNASAIPF